MCEKTILKANKTLHKTQSVCEQDFAQDFTLHICVWTRLCVYVSVLPQDFATTPESVKNLSFRFPDSHHAGI